MRPPKRMPVLALGLGVCVAMLVPAGAPGARAAEMGASEADLALSQEAIPDPVASGAELTFAITIDNLGPSDAHDVIVEDTLPNGVQLASTTGCAEDPAGAPECTLGTISAGGSAEVVIVVTVTRLAGTLENKATVRSSTDDPVPSNNVDSITVTIRPAGAPTADLSIVKVGPSDPVPAGAALTYAITVSNAGPDEAPDVTVTDALPAELTLVSTSGCAEDPAGAPTCSLGTIPPSGQAQFTIDVTLSPGATGPVTNTATVTAAVVDPDGTNDSTTAATAFNQPPVADAGPDRRGTPATALALDGTASFDPEGSALSYAWSQAAGPAAPLSAAADPRPTVDLSGIPPGSLLSYRLVVDDGTAGASAPDFVNVQVVPPPDWHRWRRDDQNTGGTPAEGPASGGSSLSVTFPDGVRSSVTFGLDGGMYVGNDDGNLYAMDLDGAVRWTFPTGGPVRTTPLIPGDGRVYFGSFDGGLYAVAERDGRLVWRHDEGSGALFRFSSPILTSASPEGGASLVIAGTSAGKLVAVDAATGSEAWSFVAGGPVYSSPALHDWRILFGSNDGFVRAVDAADGTPAWETPVGAPVQSGVAVDGARGMAFFGVDDGRVIGVDATSGGMGWTFVTGGAVTSSPAVDGVAGRIYVGSDDHRVYALDETDGTELWRFETGAEVRSSPTVAGSGDASLVYVGSCDGTLYALDPADGSLRFTFPLSSGVIIASPTASNDGLLYLGSTNRFLYLIGPDPFAGGLEVRAPRIDSLSPSSLAQGATSELTVQGRDLAADISLELGPGVQVISTDPLADDRLLVRVAVDPGARVGARDVGARRENDGMRSMALGGLRITYDCRRSDLSGDGQVDGLDLAALAARFGAAAGAGSPADLDGDGRIDGVDLSLLAAGFGRPTCR